MPKETLMSNTQRVKFRPGVRRPEPARPHLRLADFLTGEATIPKSPAKVDYESGITFPMYGNDEIGDCGPAGCGHVVQSLTTYGEGVTITVSEQDVITFYSGISGYVPGDPSTDVGVNLQDMLEYWLKNGLAGNEIVAFAKVDVSNDAEVQAAIDLFDVVITGIDLPQSAEDQFNDGKPWDYVKGSKILGGHCVPFFGYDATYRHGVTWGQVQAATLAFWKKLVSEGWILITRKWADANGVTPTGLSLYDMGQAWAAMTRQANPFPQVTPPTPQPTPTPTPTPAPITAQDLATGIVDYIRSTGVTV
jgi:hypothetical protein